MFEIQAHSPHCVYASDPRMVSLPPAAPSLPAEQLGTPPPSAAIGLGSA